jgi:hypothetical protein
MLGNVEGALNHLHSGTQILSSWKSNLQKRNSSRTLRDLIEENVIPIFSYLNCASFVTGRTIPAWLITEQDTQFKDAKEARQSFLKLMELMEKFSSAMQKLTILSPGNKYSGLRLHVPDDMLSMKYRLLLRAQQWSDALKSLQETADLSPRDTSIISMLELQHKIASIWISKAFDCTEETSWDAFVSDFEAFIVATDQMYMYGEMGCGNSQFQIELRQWQIFGLLFITAVKCRNPGIRRRALAMMAKSRKGEGNCNSQPMNEHVKRVIGLEEEGLNELRDPIGDVVPVKNGLRVVFCRNLDNMDQLRIPGNYVLSNVTDRGTVGEPRGYQEVLVKL